MRALSSAKGVFKKKKKREKKKRDFRGKVEFVRNFDMDRSLEWGEMHTKCMKHAPKRFSI